MLAGWELASKQGGTYYPPDTYKPSTFYCPFPFIVRGNGKIQSAFAVWSETYLIFFEWGQSDGKSRGQINCVVFGWGLSVSVELCTCTHTDTHYRRTLYLSLIIARAGQMAAYPWQRLASHPQTSIETFSHCRCLHMFCTSLSPLTKWKQRHSGVRTFAYSKFTATTRRSCGNCQQWADIILLPTMGSFV